MQRWGRMIESAILEGVVQEAFWAENWIEPGGQCQDMYGEEDSQEASRDKFDVLAE